MKRSSVALAALMSGFALAANPGSAEAFSFTTNYSLDSNLSGDDQWRGDILLDSVEYGGNTYSDFAFVNNVNILHNDQWTGGNTGAASADMGRYATIGRIEEDLSNEGAVEALGNNNLSSIIDGEDRGAFSMNIFFDKGFQDVLVWERGINSAMDIQAINADGDLIGNLFHISKSGWTDAGFRMGTTEIGNNIQRVGSRGISLADFGLTDIYDSIVGLRVSAEGTSTYNGPDWKIVGVANPSTSTPEPFSIMGVAIALGGAGLMKRRTAQ